MSFREYKTLEDQLAELKLGSSDHTKSWIVQRGDTLSRIAANQYGDPSLWRVIADANPGVVSLRRPQPGQELIIPPLDVFGRPLVDGR